MIRYDAIHVIDAVRHLLGEAMTVYAAGSRSPVQKVAGETNVCMVFHYPRFNVVIHDSSDNWAQDTCAEFRIEGTQAIVKGRLGVWYDYPIGRADELSLCRRESPGRWSTLIPPGRWIPDAWAWTMAEMFDAIEQNREPINSGEDYLRTLHYVERAYESMHHNRVVSIESVTDEASTHASSRCRR